MKDFTVETIRAGQPSEVRSVPKSKREFMAGVKEKRITKALPKIEVLTEIPLPEGYVRCLVVMEFEGMQDHLVPGDIVDLPDRRFKTLSFRGVVEKYKGTMSPNKLR
jgi:hypothetical protein